MIVIDTGAFLARHLSKDQHHQAALYGWRVLEKGSESCCTSNFVLDELFTLLGQRVDYHFAAERAHGLYDSKVRQILRPDKPIEIRAIARMEKYADQKISFTDCVSFELMRANRIDQVFGFDRHFKYAGFQLWPSSV